MNEKSLLFQPIPPRIRQGQVTFKREQIGKNDYPKETRAEKVARVNDVMGKPWPR